MKEKWRHIIEDEKKKTLLILILVTIILSVFLVTIILIVTNKKATTPWSGGCFFVFPDIFQHILYIFSSGSFADISVPLFFSSASIFT